MRRAVLTTGLLVAAYLGAAVVVTWPLAARLGTMLPAAAGPIHVDQYYVAWALAWQTHALVTSAHLVDANIYWPATRTLFYGTPGFALLPTFAPTFLATADATTSFNVMLLVNLALTATALHWATARATGSTAAAVAAATTYLGSQTVPWVELMPQYAAQAAMPLVAALVVGVPRTPRRMLLLAALLAFQGLGDAVYVAPIFFVATALVALVLARDPESRVGMRRVLAALALAGVALVPFYLEYALVAHANPALRQQTVWGVHAMPGALLPSRGPLALDGLVFVPIVAGLVLRRRERGARPMERRAWVCAGTWLAVGLAASWTIPTLVPAFHALLVAHVARDPVRLGIVGGIGACLLVGLGFAACVRAVSASALPAAVRRAAPAALLLAHLAGRLVSLGWPLGAHPLDPPPALGDGELAALRAGSGPVLVLPLGLEHFEQAAHARAMYASTAHWRPLLNGYSSYYPGGFAERMNLARRLPDASAFAELRRLGLSTVVIHTGLYPRLLQQPWLEAVAAGRLGGVVVRLQTSDVLVVDLVRTGGVD